MKTMMRRIGVAGLAATVVAGAFSTSQAGVIPWLYDAMFGPAYYSPYYGPYAPSYSAGYMPSACNSCSPCSTGKCSTVVASCSPCEVSSSKCDTGTPNWRSGDAPAKATLKTEVRTPTFDERKPDYRSQPNGPDVDPRTGERILKKEVLPQTEFSPPTSVDPAKPAFKRTTPAATEINPGFGTEPTGTEGSEILPPRNPKPAETEVPPTLQQESRATWSVTPAIGQTRTARKPSFRDASIARRTVDVPATAEPKSASVIVKK